MPEPVVANPIEAGAPAADRGRRRRSSRLDLGLELERVAEEVELEQQEVLGDVLLVGHVGDAREREDLVGAAGGQERGRQLEGVGGDDVVVGQAVEEQQRALELGRVGEQRAGVVDVGIGLGVAEVALGVEGVVEAPVRDRGAGDGGVEDVRAAQDGEGGEVAAEAPAADGDPGEVEPRRPRRPGRAARRPGPRGRVRPGRGGCRAPTPSRGPGCRARRSPRRRSPGRRTTATSGRPTGPARPAGRAGRRTGRGAPGAGRRRAGRAGGAGRWPAGARPRAGS